MTDWRSETRDAVLAAVGQRLVDHGDVAAAARLTQLCDAELDLLIALEAADVAPCLSVPDVPSTVVIHRESPV